MKRPIDWGRRGRWPAAVLLLLVITLASAQGGDPALYPAKASDAVPVFLLDDGFHTDLVIPRAAVQAHGGPLGAAASQTSTDPWIMVGWGDARFYEATNPWQDRIFDGLAALFGARPTVVHMEGVWGSPDRVWKSGLHRLMLSRAGLEALLARADRSFRLGPDGGPVVSAAAHDPGEQFFQSGEGFSLFHLCNHWVAELLSAAGVPTTPVLDTVPAGLKLDLELRAGL
jgi:uncharacterized protein (TIGR02117 family)